MGNNGKKEFPMNTKQRRFAFEVAQELGIDHINQSKPGLSAPVTGADALMEDALTKTDYNFSRSFPGFR